MNPDRLQLHTTLDLPLRGGSARVAVGAHELVIEAARGGFTVLWHAGREARRYILGLPRRGGLSLELRAPRYAVQVLVRDTLVLAPGTRVRGYVQVPLVPTLCWRDGGAATQLLEFAPASLGAEWGEEDRAVHSCASTWFVRFPVHGGEPRVTVPVRIVNVGDAVLSPASLPLSLRTEDLHERRSAIVVAPRRLVWDGARWSQRARRAAEVAP